MIIITLTDCPSALRGDLTKWLQEINTGVYVGKVSARVREQIWMRVKDKAKSGRATMVFTAKNEQGMDFRVHNTNWEPIDFDGIKLILQPCPARVQKLGELREGFSIAARTRKAKQISSRKKNKQLPEKYVILDVETTGLSVTEHKIIEIGALKIKEGEVESKFHALVKVDVEIPNDIKALTGLSDEILRQEGRNLSIVLSEFLLFVGDLPVVSHNVDFDYVFLRAACDNCGLPLFSNQCIDTLSLARRLIENVQNYKLGTLLKHIGIEVGVTHRCIEDCFYTKQLYEKLIEIREGEK